MFEIGYSYAQSMKTVGAFTTCLMFSTCNYISHTKCVNYARQNAVVSSFLPTKSNQTLKLITYYTIIRSVFGVNGPEILLCLQMTIPTPSTNSWP